MSNTLDHFDSFERNSRKPGSKTELPDTNETQSVQTLAGANDIRHAVSVLNVGGEI